MAGRSKKVKSSRVHRQNARKKRIDQERSKQEQEKQEQNRLMRLDRRQRCFEIVGRKPPTNPTGLVRQTTVYTKKKQIDWTPVNDWNKKFNDVVVDSERSRTIRWL
tara:strand:+ start:544 stop:861 length:318 start_codon:yes stop_codon:yes gene_type:complete